MTFTIATSVFNVEKMRFAWRDALHNWLSFLGRDDQLVIAVNKSEDNSADLIRAWTKDWKVRNASLVQIDVLDVDIPYSDPAFDGKGKDAATAAAKRDYVIFLDIDERLNVRQRKLWIGLARELEMSGYDGFLIPSVDLIGDEQRYKSVGQKWYLHKNLPHLGRGVVSFAKKEDGSIDTSKSDTCELINRETGELARCVTIVPPGLPHFMTMGQLENGEIPFVYHLGWLDQEQRIRQSEFWRPVWDSRAGESGKEPAMTLEKFAAIPRFAHRLPSWRVHS